MQIKSLAITQPQPDKIVLGNRRSILGRKLAIAVGQTQTGLAYHAIAHNNNLDVF